MSCKHKWVIEDGEEFCDFCGEEKNKKEKVKNKRYGRKPITQKTKDKYVGKKFNSLLIKDLVRRYNTKDRAIINAIALCDCGVEKEIALYNITTGIVRTCGCGHPTIVGKVKRDCTCIESNKKSDYVIVECNKCGLQRKLKYYKWNNNKKTLECNCQK